MAKQRCAGKLVTFRSLGLHDTSLRWSWRIYMFKPRVWIRGRSRPKLRSSALRAARKAAERLNIEIRSVDGEAV